ncbi:MAG: bifunctional 4-hydroxy-2-oxoglutarate aldolase/2-dehydro-3-deoxy-phosphogluconate aldolase [Sphaerochaeta sp.]|jgi:2-dehydro-3-deoxyphosphogluconate aldolase/(4S)-4-hydroxy-2-oxoglutarate aldolase|nr:bifunctional 4-hydroxy-2-oxoglutarate aldolase/2-dehydro-3-deoxy-phosphogluconate aldolase [Sphaerochaeta sp.]
MNNIDFVLKRVSNHKIISIIRGVEERRALDTIKALREGGIETIEVTMNTPGALNIIEAGQALEGISVGAGTVLDAEMARAAYERGAQFALAPNLDTEMIAFCLEKDILPVPGIFSPTELYAAHKAGAPLIKVFPAASVGPSYIKDLLGPFNGMRLLPVGGVSVDNTAAFIKAGSFAVGVGSYLANPALAASGDWKAITARAKAFVDAANK